MGQNAMSRASMCEGLLRGANRHSSERRPAPANVGGVRNLVCRGRLKNLS